MVDVVEHLRGGVAQGADLFVWWRLFQGGLSFCQLKTSQLKEADKMSGHLLQPLNTTVHWVVSNPSMHWAQHLDCVAFIHKEPAAVDASMNFRFFFCLVQSKRHNNDHHVVSFKPI